MTNHASRKKGPRRHTVGFIREADGQISHGFESWSDRDPKPLAPIMQIQLLIRQSADRHPDPGPLTEQQRSAFSEPDKEDEWNLEDFGEDLPLSSDDGRHKSIQ
jgi:hypothetical protein